MAGNRSNVLKWLLRVLVVLLLVALLAFVLRNQLFGVPVAVQTIAPTELVHTIVASGRVETPQRVTVASQLTATVAAVPVREGQLVKAGQPLVELDGSEQRAAVEQARAGVVQAEARLTQLREVGLPAAQQAVRQGEVSLQNAQRQYERLERLRRDNFIGQAQLDDARRVLDLADSQLRSARLQARSNDAQGSDVRLAEAALAQARAALKAAQARLDFTVIRAPLDGTLLTRSVERGDVVQPGKVLMLLSPTGATRLVAQIDEKNLALLQLGQKTLAAADAFPARRFVAQLAYINPGIDAQRGSVQVKFDVPQMPDFLRQDMTVSIEVEVARKPNALVLPDEALQVQGDGRFVVYKPVDGRAVAQFVQTGLRQGGKVEIVAGLQGGDAVIVSGTVRAGQRVRPLAAVAPVKPAGKS